MTAFGAPSPRGMRAVDTNVLVRLLTRDDLKQTMAAEEFVANGAWISQILLARLATFSESLRSAFPTT